MRERKYRYIYGVDGQEETYQSFIITHGELEGGQFQIAVEELKPDFDILACNDYTGRKDKNGIEIYEGDIVMVINYLNGKPWEGHIHPCEIHFIAGRFELKEHWCHESLSSSTVEKIGNIYENPELLES